MMDGGRPALCLAIPLRDAKESDALARTFNSIVAAGFTASPEVLVQVGQRQRDAFSLDLLDHPCSPSWSFQSDGGIYAAMNTLLHRATSDRILFVGAGDVVLPGLAAAASRWKTEAVVPDILQLGGVRLPDAEPGVPDRYPARWDGSLRWRNTTHHQGMACPRKHLLEAGGFREDLAVLGDYAMNLTLWQAGIQAEWTPGEDWVSVQPGGVSRQFTPGLYAEEKHMKREVLQPGPIRWVQPLWIALKSRWKRSRQPGR